MHIYFTKLLSILLLMIILFIPSVALATENETSFHVDIAASAGANLLYGLNTKNAFPGLLVTPELRLRFGEPDKMNFFVTVFGWQAVNAFANTDKASAISQTERGIYDETEIYHSIGFTLPMQKKPSDLVNTGLDHFFVGVGYANSRIKDGKFDNGPFLYIGFSTNVVSFNW